MENSVRIRELAGWMLDDDEFRPATYDRGKQSRAQQLVSQRVPFEPPSALLEDETAAIQDLLARHASRSDLLSEMAGLTWSLGVVDLRSLIAFQRRIVSNSSQPTLCTPPG